MNEEQREISKDAQDTRELTTHGGLAQFEQSLDKIPHDALVRNIRNTVADAQDRWEAKWGKGTFDWVVWVGENITNKAVSEGFSNSVRPVKSDSAARLSAAWDVIASPHIKSADYRERVQSGLSAYSRLHGAHISLEPNGVKLLDAMAEAMDIPRAHGEVTINILENPKSNEPSRSTRTIPFIHRLLTKFSPKRD